MEILKREYIQTIEIHNEPNSNTKYIFGANIAAILLVMLYYIVFLPKTLGVTICIDVIVISLISLQLYSYSRLVKYVVTGQTVPHKVETTETELIIVYDVIDLRDGKGIRKLAINIEYKNIIGISLPRKNCIEIKCVPVITESFIDGNVHLQDFKSGDSTVTWYLSTNKEVESDIYSAITNNIVANK